MTDNSSPVILGKRYELLEPLGSGGMGSVFQARDLLTGSFVALKQVAVPVDHDLLAGRANGRFDLALAQEFRALATIRHPHIISVYDFGFGRQGQPYYTMEYLDGGRTILESSKDLSSQEKADLLFQMLQALAYLHRQGILHRDLKPTNALVVDDRLKLLDFGLSVITERTVEHLTQTTSGTVAYLAPEIFQGKAYSRASDLYAVGLIAFELFSGQFPYDESNLATLLFEIVSKPVDAAAYGVSARLAPVLNKLLSKTRQARYADATEVIADLADALDLPMPTETVELRESFLQAAKFVGREIELADLSDKLAAAIGRRGAAVLIGGESGVGKSRLVDELRVRALVEGVLVLQGQAVSSGRSPYQLWADLLRTLALFSDPDEEAAATIKPLVPDLERLLGREVPDGPDTGPEEARRRLARTVRRLLSRLDQPVLILLEDLQWAGSESLQLLGEVAADAAGQAVLLVGTYRDDEPLPEVGKLAATTSLSLQRLSKEHIAELSASMLGRAGKDPQLVSLLQRETEGNAFFLVEAVRTLAGEAGQLDRVHELTLPDTIVSGGIRAILSRRLSRMSAGARPLLHLAAAAGRKLDLALLQALEPEADLESWLATAASVAVIEAQGQSWRFAHDKLREEIEASLPAEERRALHRRVAGGLEAIYPEDPERAAALAHHWSVAGDPQKELHYAEIAGRQAATMEAPEDAVRFFNRALELLAAQPESPERDARELELLTELGPQLTIVRGFGSPLVERTFLRARELALGTGSAPVLFQIVWGQFMYYYNVFDFDRADLLLKQLLRLAEESGDESLILAANHAGWTMECVRGDLARAEEYIEQGLAIYDPELHGDHSQLYGGHDPGMCALTNGSMVHWLMGHPDKAMGRSSRAQSLASILEGPLEGAISEYSAGFVACQRGEYQDAIEHGNVMLRLVKELGSEYFDAFVAFIRGMALTGQGQADEGLATAREALGRATSLRALAWLPMVLFGYLEACLAAGAVDEGLQAVRDELARSKLTGQRVFESEVRRLHGELLLAKDGDTAEEAEKEIQQAIGIARQQSAKSLELRAVISLSRLWQRQGRTEQARAKLAEIYDWFSEGFETADLVAARKLLDELQ